MATERLGHRRLIGAALLAAVGALASACAAGPTAARTPAIYVDAGGHGAGCRDSRSAATARHAGTPVCTIGRGIALAGAAGRVVVRGGSYGRLRVTGGSRTGYVTVAAAPGEAVSLPGIDIGGGASRLRFERLRLTGDGGNVLGIEEGHSSHIAIVRSVISNRGGGDLVEIGAGTSHVLVQGNELSGGGEGVAWASDQSTPVIRDVTVRGNRFRNIGTDALRPAHFDGVLVEGNDISGVVENGDHSDALQSYAGGAHLVFRNNYVHDDDAEGFFIKDGHVDDVTVANNVFVRNRGAASQIKAYDTTGLRLLNNLVWDNEANVTLSSGLRDVLIRNNIFEHLDADASVANVTQDHNLIGGSYGWHITAGDIRGRPRFVDAATGDYRLAQGSRGIDAGSAVGAPARDKACHARYDEPGVANRGAGAPPYVDIGPLERRPGTSAADVASPGCGSRPPARGGAHRCGVGARAVRHASLRISRPRLVHGRLSIAVQLRNACRIAVGGTAAFHRNGHLTHANLARSVHRLRPGRTRRIALRLPRPALAAARHGRTVTVHLRIRAGAAGRHRDLRATVRVKR